MEKINYAPGESRLIKIVYSEKTGRLPQTILRSALPNHELIWKDNIIDVIDLDEEGKEINRKAIPRPILAKKHKTEVTREDVEAYLTKLGKSKASITSYLGPKVDKTQNQPILVD